MQYDIYMNTITYIPHHFCQKADVFFLPSPFFHMQMLTSFTLGKEEHCIMQHIYVWYSSALPQ